MIPEFYPDKPDGRLQVACRLSEGDMTVANGATALGTDITYSFTAPLAYGDKVVAAGVDSAGRIIVAKRTNSDEQAIGEVMTAPSFVGFPPTTLGVFTAGNYTQREATIFFYGKRIRTLDVYLAQSDNLAAMNFLKPCAVSNYANYFQESTLLTSRISLQAASASASAASTVKVAVLEGYESGTTADAT